MSETDEDTPQRRYPRLKVCVNYRAGDVLPSCGAKGSRELAQSLQEEIAKRGDFITLETVHCLGKCHIGPTLKLLPYGPFLQGAQAADAACIADLLHTESYDTLEGKFSSPVDVEPPQSKP